VEVQAAYSFENNEFINKTIRKVTVAPEMTILKASIGGIAGAMLSAGTGYNQINGEKLTLDVFPTSEYDLSDNRDNPDFKRSLIGTTSMEGSAAVLKIIERIDDADADGLSDQLEDGLCTSAYDADTDDDGLSDGIEDANHNGIVDPGETDPCRVDSDGDGIQDGTERGAVSPVPDPDGPGPAKGTDLAVFIPDTAPSSTTAPNNPDADGDGIPDGIEDANKNGSIDPGETDPNAARCYADFDADGDTDGKDLLAVMENLGLAECGADCQGDADADFDVDVFDLQIIAAEMGRQNCP
jgi:hypothetical protein